MSSKYDLTNCAYCYNVVHSPKLFRNRQTGVVMVFCSPTCEQDWMSEYGFHIEWRPQSWPNHIPPIEAYTE